MKLAALIACALAWSHAATTTAQPTLRVRAETRIELSAVQGTSDVRVELTLRDDLGAGIVGAEIALTLRAEGGEEHTQRIRTGVGGEFNGGVRSRGLTTLLVARYAGSGTYAGTRAERTLDAGQLPTTLTLSATGGEELDLDQTQQSFFVHAASGSGGQGLATALLDELGRVLASGHTDASGDWRLTVPSDELGPVGAGRLAARVAGDARRADAQVELPIVRFRRTRLTLRVAQDPLPPDASFALGGMLSDSRGGLGHRAVGLYIGDAHWFTVLTDAAGAYSAERMLPEMDAAEVAIEARYASEGPGRPDAVSEVARRRLATPFSWAWLALLVPLLLMAAGVYWGTRTRRPAQSGEHVQSARPPVSHIEPGAVRGRRRRFDAVDGTVCDGRDRRPLGGALVRALLGDELVGETRTDADGQFALERLPPGELVIEIDAEAYELFRMALELPHRGRWTRMSVLLRSLRWQASEAFQPVAVELLGTPERAASRTTTEAAAHAHGPLESPISHLAQAVDRATYASDEPRREAVVQIERNAEQISDKLRSER